MVVRRRGERTGKEKQEGILVSTQPQCWRRCALAEDPQAPKLMLRLYSFCSASEPSSWRPLCHRAPSLCAQPITTARVRAHGASQRIERKPEMLCGNTSRLCAAPALMSASVPHCSLRALTGRYHVRRRNTEELYRSLETHTIATSPQPPSRIQVDDNVRGRRNPTA